MQTITPLQLAEKFYEIYERIAPLYNYETNHKTKVFNPNSENGMVMIATCDEILKYLKI